MNDGLPRDSALQPERTALSWRRTALAVAAGSLAAATVLAGNLGPGGGVLGALGLVWSVDLGFTARRRYKAAHWLMAAPPGVVATTRAAGPDVVRTLVVTAVLGVACLACVLALALGR